MPFTDRTPDAITTETRTKKNDNPQITYRYDLSTVEKTVLTVVLKDGNPGMIGNWLLDILNKEYGRVTITLTVPNKA